MFGAIKLGINMRRVGDSGLWQNPDTMPLGNPPQLHADFSKIPDDHLRDVGSWKH